MCSTCGCGQPDPPGKGSQGHGHDHPPGPGHDHHHQGPNLVEVERSVLAENDRLAAYNRGYFDARGIRCFNLISAPGSGKTTLLEVTLVCLKERGIRAAVIEGDQRTDLDARRIAKTGVKVVQIETGRACHLDAHQIQHAIEDLSLEPGTLLFIENVGNLICPTEFNLGEHERVVLLSVTEGSDKPAKYPLAFHTATAVVVSKSDLIPHVDFDSDETRRLVTGLNAAAPVFQLSAKTGDGLSHWLDWLTRPR